MSGSRRGRSRRRSGAALLALALACAPAAAAAELPPGSATYGLVAFSGNGAPGDHAARVAAYRRLHDAGVRAIRLDLSWVDAEPQGAPYKDFDFTRLDADVRAASEAGLGVIAILAYGHPDYSERGRLVDSTPAHGGLPPFGVGNANHFPPDDPADFADYARAAAAHFGDEVIAWEVWNEQNGGWRFWPPREDPAAYAELLCASHDAIRAVDASTPVVYGGVFFPAVPPGLPGMSGPDFVRASYAASERPLGECFDALAYHPYPYPFTAPELDVPVRGSVLSARDEMLAALPPEDRDKPLWITEVGWPTHDRGYGVPEAKQAQYVARMQAATFAQGVPVLTWYTYGDYADPTGVNQEAWFGFFRPDGTPKPSYDALATFGRVFEGARFVADLSGELGLPSGGGPPRADVVGGRGFALAFERPDGTRVTALWHASESVAEGQGALPAGGAAPPKQPPVVRLPVSGTSVTVVDHLGAERTLAADGGAVSLELGPAPLYVVDGS